MTTREPEWTEQDLGEMRALALYRSWLCPSCGGLLEDCTSHEETGPRFVVQRTLCRATRELIEQQTTFGRTFDEKSPDPYPAARLWGISMQKG